MDFCLSQDLGKIGDYHGQILTETKMKVRGRTAMARGWDEDSHQDVMYPEIIVKWIDRNQDSYDKLIDDTLMRMQKVEIYENCWHVVDATGVGIPTIDFMRRNGLTPIGIWITGGHSVNSQDYGYTVPKLELINTLQLAFSSGMLKIAQGVNQEYLNQILHEFQVFKDKKATSGKMEAWRESDHDDLVMSLAINVWWVLKVSGINLLQRPKYDDDSYSGKLIYGM
ncbi:MAG TPA: hypothetical protein VJ869_12295 [Sphaerochaeta sp.]|nr:hypothetical protein [Sphaerochaeta sp.]